MPVMENINEVYNKIIEILRDRGENEHVKHLQEKAAVFGSSSEVWGGIGIYLRELKNKDPNVYKILKNHIEEFGSFWSRPYKNHTYVPWVFSRKRKDS
jgi:hypothetical protein